MLSCLGTRAASVQEPLLRIQRARGFTYLTMNNSPKTTDSEDWTTQRRNILEMVEKFGASTSVAIDAAYLKGLEDKESIRTAAYREGHKHGEGLASMAYEANYKKGRESALREALEALERIKCDPGDIVTGWVVSDSDFRKGINRLLDT